MDGECCGAIVIKGTAKTEEKPQIHTDAHGYSGKPGHRRTVDLDFEDNDAVFLGARYGQGKG